MSRSPEPNRREFLGQLGVVAAASVTNAPFHTPHDRAARDRPPRERAPGDWDMSWVDKLAKSKYKAVFDSPALSDGAAPDLASGIWNDYTEVYGANDGACMVIVMRQLGQVMAFNDTM